MSTDAEVGFTQTLWARVIDRIKRLDSDLAKQIERREYYNLKIKKILEEPGLKGM